jgi:large subunit ribosomal protein L35
LGLNPDWGLKNFPNFAIAWPFSLGILTGYQIFMPKPIARSKTRKSVAKRFKVTGTGKLVRSKPGRRHLLSSKSAGRKRKLAKSAVVSDQDTPRMKECLPFI